MNMTRKLVVTVFAISLSVLGCGSDDGDTKDGSADVVRLDVAPKLDTVKPLDTVAKDVSSDTVKTEVSSEVKADIPVTTDGSDASKDGGIDVPTGVDVPAQDDTGPTSGSDAGDGGAVD
jgi:hypothetical protein